MRRNPEREPNKMYLEKTHILEMSTGGPHSHGISSTQKPNTRGLNLKPPDSNQNFLISNIERAEESKLVRKLTLMH